MRNNIEITGIIAADAAIETIQALLETAGVTKIGIITHPYYYDWLENLPKERIPGLGNACLDWIRHWCSGDGDQSSETCIIDAIETLGSDVPVELAEAVYDSVTDYSKSKFEAAGLTIEMVDGCIEDLRKK